MNRPMNDSTNRLVDILATDAHHSIKGVDLSILKGKTMLITGASGIVGTYLLAGLKNAGLKKVYTVCHSTPENYWQELCARVDATVIQGDLTDVHFLAGLPAVDFIIHAAGYGQPGKFMTNPQKTIALNTTSTQGLLSKLNPGGSFLFLSSSEVYSGLTIPPFVETDIGTTGPDHPRACYIEGKRCGEAIVNTARSQGIKALSARLSLAYGPGVKTDDKRVLNSFIARALTERKIEMMDAGEALRTYCYVTDAVRMMWNILLHGKDATYNVGGTSRTTIADLARMIGDALKVPVSIPQNTTQALSGAPDDVRLDLTKYENEFGAIDFVSLEEGLRRSISWQKELRSL
jgi:UDP-glucuronate decarboxylase